MKFHNWIFDVKCKICNFHGKVIVVDTSADVHNCPACGMDDLVVIRDETFEKALEGLLMK